MSANHSEKAPSSGETSPKPIFRLPSPYVHRRQRTVSASEAAARAPVRTGKIRDFCRQKGHGFITPDEGNEDLFVHISDIDGEYVPIPGDEITYQTVLVPPKNEKIQAVHVKITHLKEGEVHQRWDAPVINH